MAADAALSLPATRAHASFRRLTLIPATRGGAGGMIPPAAGGLFFFLFSRLAQA